MDYRDLPVITDERMNHRLAQARVYTLVPLKLRRRRSRQKAVRPSGSRAAGTWRCPRTDGVRLPAAASRLCCSMRYTAPARPAKPPGTTSAAGSPGAPGFPWSDSNGAAAVQACVLRLPSGFLSPRPPGTGLTAREAERFRMSDLRGPAAIRQLALLWQD